MNRKLDEKLIELAFGDLPEEEATRVVGEASQDPEAARALQDYRDMRDGLRKLSDIPPHQLSNERLRAAILNRGAAKPARPAGISWLWMPAAAAVLTLGTLMIRQMQTPTVEPSVAIKESTNPLQIPDLDVPVAGGTTFDGATMATKAPAPDITESAPRVADAPTTSSANRIASAARRSPRRSIETRPKAAPKVDDTPISADMVALASNVGNRIADGSGARNEAAPAPMTMAGATAMRAPAPTPKTPIIIIEAETDALTGAQRATEVDNASNVLVGG